MTTNAKIPVLDHYMFQSDNHFVPKIDFLSLNLLGKSEVINPVFQNSHLTLSINELELLIKIHENQFQLLLLNMQNYIKFLENQIKLDGLQNELQINFDFLKNELEMENDLIPYLINETKTQTSTQHLQNLFNLRNDVKNELKPENTINFMGNESKTNNNESMIAQISIPNLSYTKVKVKRVICPIESCHRPFFDRYCLKRHLRIVHKIGYQKKFPCLFPNCTKVFNERWVLIRHQKTIHKLHE